MAPAASEFMNYLGPNVLHMRQRKLIAVRVEADIESQRERGPLMRV